MRLMGLIRLKYFFRQFGAVDGSRGEEYDVRRERVEKGPVSGPAPTT